jgi:pyruvate/2-oxoglutarate dehydrogenase complex dihydrolipoamide acyltransferase (E2) component
MGVLEMTVPSPGESISEVEISSWLVSDGDYVKKDQSIAEVDSDKATLELPAEESGIIKIKVGEGESVRIGDVVCLIDLTTEQTETKTFVKKEEDKLQVGRQVITEYKIGDIVRWCWSEQHRSTYVILSIDKKGVLLKQNFGMRQINTGSVPISEIELDY